VGINNNNQVIGTETSGSNAFIWKDGAKTYLANLIPADYQGELGGISPRLLSNSDTSSDGTIHILFDATFTDPTDGGTSQKTYVLNGPAAALSATTCTLQEVQLPDGVNSWDIRCINANGVIAGISNLSASGGATSQTMMARGMMQTAAASSPSSTPWMGPPLKIEGHWRGSVNEPGDIVPNTSGTYGNATVMMENANDEVVTGGTDYATNASNGHVDKAKDYDLVKVVLYWTGGKAPGTLSLTGTGMQVDGSKKVKDSGFVVESGSSHINFYDKDGNAKDAGDFVIDPSSPDGSYMDDIVTTGSCVFFIEGDKNFGYEGSIANSGKSMGGAMLKFSFASTSGTATQRLLVYRGGFLCFFQPNGYPCHEGEFDFYDGKGRVDHSFGGKGKEFQTVSARGDDGTDWGNCIKTWHARSGKPIASESGDPDDGNLHGQDYDVKDGFGHTPPGWWLITTTQIDALTGRQKDYTKSGQTRLHQGNYRRWLVDDSTGGYSGSGYTTTYYYDASKQQDINIGAPVSALSLAYKADLTAILPTKDYGRDGIQIHPDGRKNGTAGCVGVQSVKEVQDVSKVLRNYHGLKLKFELE